jgi:hypothetical protein
LNGLATVFSSMHKNANAKMPGFVFIASADVLEFFPSDEIFYSNSAIKNSIQSFFASSIQLLLVGHESSLDVATQHGVFVVGEGEGNKQGLNKGFHLLEKRNVTKYFSFKTFQIFIINLL